MKRNIDDFNGMGDFIISIVTVVAWVLIGTIMCIGYFTIETKGESIMLSFVSAIFTIISSLGIAATIIIYFKQKNDSRILRNEDLLKKKDAIKIITRKDIADITNQVSLISSHVQRLMYDDGLKIANSINPAGIEKCLFNSSEISHDVFYILSNLLDSIYKHKNILINQINHIKKRHHEESAEMNVMTGMSKSVFSITARFHIEPFCNIATDEFDKILKSLMDEAL